MRLIAGQEDLVVLVVRIVSVFDGARLYVGHLQSLVYPYLCTSWAPSFSHAVRGPHSPISAGSFCPEGDKLPEILHVSIFTSVESHGPIYPSRQDNSSHMTMKYCIPI